MSPPAAPVPESPGAQARSSGALSTAAFALLPAAVLAGLVLLWTGTDLPVAWSAPWAPGLGVDLAFRVDGLSALMMFLIAGIGLNVFVYAGGYLAGDPRRVRVLGLLSAFLVAMVGCVTADDLVLLFVFWELTSVLSFLLVGTSHEDESARRAARQALLVTGGGGLALLAGVLLLAHAAGTNSLSAIVALGPELLGHPLVPWALGCVIVGCFTKSAQFPFHFWLPNAMAAPTPASAYLHSATMVKLGVYLLARLDAGFGAWGVWDVVLVTGGSLTAAWAMVLVLRERDLKRILAWSTVAALGTLVMLVGLPGSGAAIAVATFLLAHALYKAPLFFVAGNVDHGTGTRILDRLGGLRSKLPWTAAAAALAGVSMAGLPSSFGFLAKDAIQTSKLEAETLDVLIAVAQSNMFVGAVSVAVAGVAAFRVFWRHPGVNETCDAHEGGAAMVVPPLLVAGAGIVLGLFPGLARPLLESAAGAMCPPGSGPGPRFAVDAVPVAGTVAASFAAGAVVFLGWDRVHAFFERLRWIDRAGMSAHYDRALGALARTASAVTRRLQHGRLPAYVGVLFAAVTVPVAALLLAHGAPALPGLDAPGPAVGGAAALIAVGAVLACVVRARMLVLLTSGLVGYGSALLFLFTGAPDLAFTQFCVETVLVVVVAALLLRLRRLDAERGNRPVVPPEPGFRPAALAIAAAFGACLAALLLAVSATPLDGALSDFYGARAFTEAHGRNVVNVIIVDFRGLDTLGEIAVLAFSFLAAVPLLAALRSPAPGVRS